MTFEHTSADTHGAGAAQSSSRARMQSLGAGDYVMCDKSVVIAQLDPGGITADKAMTECLTFDIHAYLHENICTSVSIRFTHITYIYIYIL